MRFDQSIRQRTLRFELLGGTWINLGSSVIAEIAAAASFDWLLFDLEHGLSEFSDLLHQLQAAAAFPAAAIVRVPSVDAWIFKRILDLGPHGLMVPDVQDSEMARQVVSLARVPPRGKRGAAQTTRASGYGVNYARHVSEVNDQLVLIAQIESQQGLKNASAIAGVDGIDVLFVGPTDLSVDLGTSADHTDSQFRQALTAVVAAARQNGKGAGILARNAEQARAYFELGFRFIAVGSDRGIVATGMRRNARDLRELDGKDAAAAE